MEQPVALVVEVGGQVLVLEALEIHHPRHPLKETMVVMVMLVPLVGVEALAVRALLPEGLKEALAELELHLQFLVRL
jgi:hypothetical protein